MILAINIIILFAAILFTSVFIRNISWNIIKKLTTEEGLAIPSVMAAILWCAFYTLNHFV